MRGDIGCVEMHRDKLGGQGDDTGSSGTGQSDRNIDHR